jgi:tetratricopeptide (TPR) repeat protein
MRIEWMEKEMKEAEQLISNQCVAEGMRLLSALLYEEPGYGSLHNHLGWAHLYFTADVVRAEEHLKLAIKFEPGFAAPYLHLGALYIRTRQYDLALAILTLGLALPSANRVAMLESIGQVYELKREYGNAIKTYKEALASTVGAEVTGLTAGIQRCRKKRWATVFTF